MPARKRTKAQREDDLLRIAEMHAQVMSQSEIAAVFGVTQPQICHDLKEIHRRWSAPGRTNPSYATAPTDSLLNKDLR